VHIYVEAIDNADANALRDQYHAKVSGWLAELSAG